MVKNSMCWNFQWTNSLLVNMIPGDILLAMDPALARLLYKDIVKPIDKRILSLNLHLKTRENYSSEDYEQAFTIYFCTVRFS